MKAAQRYQLLVTLLFILALLYLFSTLRFDLVYQGMIDSNKFLLILGLISLFSSAILKIIRFGLVTQQYDHRISLMEASLIQMVGISVAILTPARLGEGSKAVLLNKRQGIPISTSFGIVIFERFFDIIFLTFGAGAFLFSSNILSGTVSLLTGIFFLVVVVSFVIFLRFFNLIERLIPVKFKSYFKNVRLKKNPILSLIVLVTTGLAWMLEAGLVWLLALSMNVRIPFFIVFGIVCIGAIAVIFSVLPAGIGTTDLSFMVLLPAVGVATETAFSILLIYRFFGIILPFLLAIIALNYQGLSFKGLKQEIRG